MNNRRISQGLVLLSSILCLLSSCSAVSDESISSNVHDNERKLDPTSNKNNVQSDVSSSGLSRMLKATSSIFPDWYFPDTNGATTGISRPNTPPSIVPPHDLLMSMNPDIPPIPSVPAPYRGMGKKGKMMMMMNGGGKKAHRGPCVCTDSISATTLIYTGRHRSSATVIFEGKDNGIAVYNNVDLETGTILASDNGFTIDAGLGHELGLITYVSINGVLEKIHTGCFSATYEVGKPAPLDEPKGYPSSNWSVVDFMQQDHSFKDESCDGKTPNPTRSPTRKPTAKPTAKTMTFKPTDRPTRKPTPRPTRKPTGRPTLKPIPMPFPLPPTPGKGKGGPSMGKGKGGMPMGKGKGESPMGKGKGGTPMGKGKGGMGGKKGMGGGTGGTVGKMGGGKGKGGNSIKGVMNRKPYKGDKTTKLWKH